ncbi:MAG: leucine-rich repeat domain-containing protein [Promethearchaeota archaeon]
MKKEVFLKIILIGDGAVGKTSLIRRFMDRRFEQHYLMTLGTDFHIKEIELENTIVKLQIWDFAGQQWHKFIQGSFYRGTAGALVLFDLTRTETFNPSIINWLDVMQKSTGRIPIVLTGNKVDLADDIEVMESDAVAFASKLSCPYVETSAKTGANVDEAFQKLINVILESRGIQDKIEGEKDRPVDSAVLPSSPLAEMTRSDNKWGVKPEQAKILEELEKIIKQTIPRVSELRWDTLGIKLEDDEVIGLGLYNCGLTELPEVLNQLNSLKELMIYKNPLKTISNFTFNLKSLQTLGLGQTQIKKFPVSLKNLKLLKNLSLNENKISTIPHFIGELKSLEHLNLTGNQLESLPEEIGKLKSLQTLDLSGNRLDKLPNSFGQLELLREVDLSSNQLVDLPENFGNLRLLINLNLYFNQLNNLPKTLQTLESLQLLNLSYNHLSFFPESVLSLKTLQFIGLANNNLTKLPMSLWRLTNLEEIQLDGNPWDGEWKEVASNTIEVLFDYCRKHDTITIFCSHAEADYHSGRVKLEQIANYLVDQEEIYQVYYSEEAIQGGMNFEEFMRKYVPVSHLLVFFATKQSLKSGPCKLELQLAIDNQIPIIPILDPSLKWQDLNRIKLTEPTGESFQLAKVKGLTYKDDIAVFGAELYKHIYEFKRSINLYNKEQIRIDQFKLAFAELLNDFIKSKDYNDIITKNYPSIRELYNQFKTNKISFPQLTQKIFELIT